MNALDTVSIPSVAMITPMRATIFSGHEIAT